MRTKAKHLERARWEGLLCWNGSRYGGRTEEARLKPADGTLALILALLMMCGLLTLFSATYYKAVDQGRRAAGK